MDNTERIQQYLKELNLDWSAAKENADNSNEEYRFALVAGAQWEGWLEKDYEERAKLELNVVGRFARRVKAAWRNNRQGVNFSPSDDATTKDDADLLDGLIRRDTQESGGQASIDTAVDGAIDCGFGAIVLKTEYDEPGDPESEHQNIVICEQPCAYNTVIFDAGASRADKRDANHVTILIPMSESAFEREYPGKELHSVEVDGGYWSGGGNDDLVYVATRYEVDEKRVRVHLFTNPATMETLYIDEDENMQETVQEMSLGGFVPTGKSKRVKRRTIYKCMFSGSDILEPRRRIVGEWLPVIPFYGNRYWVDGQERYNGVIRELIDPQRALNMVFSLTAESAATASESKPIFDPDQMKNASVRDSWSKDTHSNAYRLAQSLKDKDGNIVAMGPMGFTPGSQMSPAIGGLTEMIVGALREGTGGEPQDIADPNASGKAIQAIIKRVDMNTQVIFDNIDKSIKHFGTVYQSMAREVYSGPNNAGRTIRTVNQRGETELVKLLQLTGRSGKGLERINDIGKGKFSVVVGVSKDYHTQREEAFEAMKDKMVLIPEGDPLRGIAARQLFMLQDAPELRDFTNYIRRDLIRMQVIEPTTEEDMAFVEQLGNQPDPNAGLIEAATDREASAAVLNEAKTAQVAADAAKKAKEAEQTHLENMQLAEQLTNPPQVNGGM